jgi:lysylphosphatidylglycerol synthetase-like protein (DUF2156 family)
MAPIEVFFGALVVVFTLIGLARGFLKELGVTTMLMFVLFFLSRFESQLESGLTQAMSAGSRFVTVNSLDTYKCWFFLLVIVGTAFISYQGETLAFGGELPRGSQAVLLALLVGVLNGYLIAGSIWFYMHKTNYPIAWMGFSADKLSGLAKGMIQYLPISFLGQPFLFGQSLLLYLSGVLLLARVIR